jgi:hypothetical protein
MWLKLSFSICITGWLFIIDPFKERLTDFYPLNAPKLEGGPLRRFFSFFFFWPFNFVLSCLLAPAHSQCIPPASSACALLHPSFSLSLCLDLHVFNVNATKNHDPFLLIRFSFTVLRSFISSGLFSRYEFSADTLKFLRRWWEISRLNFFLPLYHYDEPSFSGRIWTFSLGLAPGSVSDQYDGRQRLSCPQNRNRNRNRCRSWMSFTGGCLNLFFLALALPLGSTSNSSTYYRCFLYIWLRHFDFLLQ